jgi:hypothetical protein
MLLLLALVVFLLFAGLGFFAHVLWLGLIASVLLLVLHMWRQGLTRGTPTSRLNVRLVAALRGFLDDLLTSRARERQLKEQQGTTRVDAELDIPELPVGSDDILDADIVEDDDVPACKTPAASTRRPEARASVRERASHWRAMTPAKVAKAEQLAADGVSQAEIARRLKVSRSTVSRHLAGKNS